MYVQFAFVLDRVKELAPNIPIGRTSSHSRRCSNGISRRCRFMLIVHHTDETREFAYDRKSAIGRLDKALDEANTRGWTVVDMKKDWKRIFPFEQ